MTPTERATAARALRGEGQSIRAIATALGCGLGTVHRALAKADDVRAGAPKKSTSKISRSGRAKSLKPDAFSDYRKQLVAGRKEGLRGIVAILCADPELSEADRDTIKEAGSATIEPTDLRALSAFTATKLRQWESTAMMTPQQLATAYNALALRMEAAVQLSKEADTAQPEAINITFSVNSEHVRAAPPRVGIDRPPRPAPTVIGDTIDTED